MLISARIKTTFTAEELYEQLLYLPHVRPKGKAKNKKFTNEELAMMYHSSETAAAKKKWAREQLILRNMNLARGLAHKNTTQKYPFEDLVQAGYRGLIESVDHYDPSKGVPFHIYSCFWIRKYIMEYKSTFNRAVRVPAHKEVEINRILRAREKFIKENGNEPTGRQIKETDPKIKASPKEIILLIKGTGSVSLEDLPGELPGEGRDDDQREYLRFLIKAVMILDERARRIVSMRHGIGEFKGQGEKNFNQVSRDLGISAERVRQIYHESTKKMRVWYRKQFAFANVRTAGIISSLKNLYNWLRKKFRPEPGSWSDPRFSNDSKTLHAARQTFSRVLQPLIHCHQSVGSDCKNLTVTVSKNIAKTFKQVMGYSISKEIYASLPAYINSVFSDYDSVEFGPISADDVADMVIYLMEMAILSHYNLLK